MLDDIEADPPSRGKLGLVERVVYRRVTLSLGDLMCRVKGRHLHDGNRFGFGVLHLEIGLPGWMAASGMQARAVALPSQRRMGRELRERRPVLKAVALLH